MQTADLIAALVGAAVAIAFVWLWVVAILDVTRRREWEFPPLDVSVSPKVFWMFVVLFGSGIGSFFYYVIVMRPNPRERR